MSTETTNTITLIETAQQNLIKLLEPYTIEQKNTIPAGFNNNLIWNFAHSVAVLQLLCYSRSGLDTRLDSEFVQAYKNGSKPKEFVSENEYQLYLQYASDAISFLKTDYDNSHFKNFTGFTTAVGLTITTFELVLQYVLYHYGMHIGYVMALRKVLNQNG